MSLNPNKFRILPGGLRASVQHMSRQDLVHDTVLAGTLATVIAHEAKAHQADFHAARFDKVIEAVKDGKISAYFILAGWETCQMKVAGASIEFPTLITKWDGKKFQHYPAMYGEDTCLLSPVLKELIRERPHNKSLPPNIGLGGYFEQERIKRWTTGQFGDAPLGQTARGRVGEYSAHSSAMIKLMNGLNASLGTEVDGTILELDGLTRAMKDKWKFPVEIQKVPVGNGAYPNIFLAHWSAEGGKQQVVASFTHGLSTFTGEPVTRVQFTSNGNLPGRQILECALASLLAAGQDVIGEQRWGADKDGKRLPSPSIPLSGSKQEAYGALLDASRSEMLTRIGAAVSNSVLGITPPVMRIHALQEPEINAALKAMDAKTRNLGPHPMLPAVIDFKNMPKESLNFDPTPARPVTIINRVEVANDPIFSLVANG